MKGPFKKGFTVFPLRNSDQTHSSILRCPEIIIFIHNFSKKLLKLSFVYIITYLGVWL
jgi:hypothetical protein